MKDGFVKVASCSPKIKVCDVKNNEAEILNQILLASGEGAVVIVFPQLCLTGATCGDMFFSDTLLRESMESIKRLADASKDINAIIAVGMPVKAKGKLYDCVAVLCKGEIRAFVPRTMPDDKLSRWFECYSGGFEAIGSEQILMTQTVFECEELDGLKIGFEVGSDASIMSGVCTKLVSLGATVICNCSAEPELVGKDKALRKHLLTVSKELICGYIYAGGCDGESTTDCAYGATRIICENGRELASYDGFISGVKVSEIDIDAIEALRRRTGLFSSTSREDGGMFPMAFSLDVAETALTRPIAKNPFVPDDSVDRMIRCKEVFEIQVQGLKKRVEHTNAKSLVIGISGGLDSTLALLVCVKTMDVLKRPRTDVIAVTMPCFGTTKRTRSNAQIICEQLGVTFREVNIAESVKQHFADISHDMNDHSVVFENAQARERTQVLMDIANGVGGLVIGTGDLSELALGWATYNGDQMSMYGVNASVPKTLVRALVEDYAHSCPDEVLEKSLLDVVATPVSPELLPTDESQNSMNQKTEDLVGPYELHDFFLFYAVRFGFEPKKIYRMACYVFADSYDSETILKWLKTFFRRFFAQQFKRSCLPDGAKVGSVSLSPRGDLSMPSDAVSSLWLSQLENL
ncbi:MAG: NAD(+) synthase [Oscillospiraceae bacterium]|nr:NAD(+) synthase [Oscillospiraceae bacterium]